jgi:hypothetical protein
MKNSFTFLLVLFLATNGIAQDWASKMSEPNANFYDIKKDFEAYWANRDVTEKGKGYKAFKRWENFVERRVYPTGDLSLLGLTAKNYEAFLLNNTPLVNGKPLGGSNLISSATFTPIGPMGAISGTGGGQLLKSGRVNFVTIDPTNSNNLWLGAPAGGLWKSTNGGASWTTNTDFLSVTGCSDLAIDPTNTNILYLATGDGDAGDTRSIGVLKSTNGGLTWNATGLTNAVTNNFLIRRLIINPTNTQILLAATNSGIYRTTNGGTNWTQVVTGNTYDLEFKAGNPSVVYAAGSTFRMSTDGGITYTTINNGIPTTGVNRMAIAVTPADANYVYVLASSSTNSGLQGFYKSINGGTAFTQMTTTLNLLGWATGGTDTGGQGWYDLCIAASPLNKDEVVTGGVNVWRTTNGGGSWAIYGHWTGSGAPFTHADQHDLEYDAAGNLFNTNDGTLYKRNGGTWTEISGTINISQIYRIGMSSITANKWITGHQDNGTSIWNGTTYFGAMGGDGMDCFIDRTNDNNMFAEYYNGALRKSTNGGSSWSNCTSGLTGSAPWVTIWKQDPMTNTVLYCGYSEMFKSTNSGGAWTQLAAMPGSGTVREFAIAPSNNQVIYVLKSTGIFKTTNGGTSWTNVTGTVPVGSAAPEYICIDPTDPNNAWVVLSGYSAGNKVFMTTNGGTSWANFSANLPNIPANCIVYQPNTADRVYVGMDVGIYYRDNVSASWTLYNTGLPNTPVSELEISPASPTLLHAATYGRGVWVASVFTPALPPVSIFTVNSNPKCTFASVTFSDQSANLPTAWSWTVQPSAGVSASGLNVANPSFTFTIPGNYTISMQANNGSGLGNVATRTVAISGPPALVLSANSQTLCANTGVTFSVSGASTYTWSNGGGNGAVVIYSPAVSSVYTVTGNANGCISSTTLSVIVSTPPNVNVSGTSAICIGNNANILASGALTYTWNTGSNSPFITVNPTITSTYIVSGTGTGGCIGQVFKTIVVNPLPVISVLSTDTLLCPEQTAVLMANGGVTYSWMPGGQNTNPLIVIPGTSTTFTCSGIDNNGCENSTAFTVSVSLCESINARSWQAQNMFSLYPNPTKGKLVIQSVSKPQSDVKLELMDVTGRVILTQSLLFNESSCEINISQIAAGTYFVSFYKEGQRTEPIKLIKE